MEEQYSLVKGYYNKYLKKYGVVLPKLYNKDKKITKNALVLICLSLNYPKTRQFSKTELTKFVRNLRYSDKNLILPHLWKTGIK